MKTQYTIRYTHYIYASYENDAIGDMSEGLCLFSDRDDVIVALGEDGIAEYLEVHGITNVPHGPYTIQHVLDTHLSELELQVGVYTYTPMSIDVVGSKDDIEDYIALIKDQYPPLSELSAVPLCTITPSDGYAQAYYDLHELFQDESFDEAQYKEILSEYGVTHNDATLGALKQLYNNHNQSRIREIDALIMDDVYPEGSPEDVLVCERQDLQVSSLQFENLFYHFT